jgi:serine-type D-Ala-D-Ala carboxypeptidase/endopeptidase (penicillin-binding protein 4)
MFAAVLALSLTAQLDAVLDSPKLEGAVVAAQVTTMDGRVLYERNPSFRVMPASNQKLLTCAYALQRLGLDHKPVTRIWRESDRVVVDAPGDPMLSHAQLVEARKKLGLDGSLPVHVRQAYSPGWGPNWNWNYLQDRYAAKVSAFTVDRGGFELWTEGGRLFFLPEAYGAVATHLPSKGSPRVELRGMRAVVTGELPKERTRVDTLAIEAPDRAAASLLGSSFVETELVPDREPDHVIEGPPVSEILRECLVRSDNNIAEHLLLLSAIKEGPLPERPYAAAQERLKNFLVKEVGLRANDFRPADGSGLSRHNMVTSRGIAALLRWADRQPTAKVWRESLAAPGRGTLASRLQGSSFVGKTGTLDMASSLSGYIRTADGQNLVVSLVMNHYACPAAEARGLQDDFMRILEKTTLRGTKLAAREIYESGPSNSKSHIIALDWLHRSGRDRLASRSGTHRRAEPAHAVLHRAE